MGPKCCVGNSLTPDMDTVPSRRRGLVEMLPNLLKDTEALKFKSPELCEYVMGLDRQRFYETKYLEDIKAHLEKHRLVYWKRLDVTIAIQASLGLTYVKGVPQRVREFYNSIPQFHGCTCYVAEEGSSCKPWVMRCRNSLGACRTKKVARMIVIIKEHIDPSFDPEGDGPPPTPSGLSDRKRPRETMNMAASSDDNELVSDYKKRLAEDEETTK